MKTKLRKQIQAYLDEDIYPLHMPGHKRRLFPEEDLPYAWDMTEIEGMDNLHHAEGILKEAMDRTASLCGSDQTWYLVNGSTAGNLAGIFALTHQNDEVIMARNCHKSLYHAVQLRNLKVHWIMPDTEDAFEISGSVDPDTVKHALEQYPCSKAVVLTSPTYEGVVSDVHSIAEICHQKNIPLFVDEAHGAHFGLFPGFPDSAIHCGADLVVQSFHKTLPSLTGTAVLHKKGNLVSSKNVEQALDIFETSSPSYPMMVSLDACTEYLMKDGKEDFRKWQNMLMKFDDTLSLKHMHVLCHEKDKPETHHFFDYDPGKILIHTDTMNGSQLQNILRKDYRFELEMSMGRNVLAMTSVADEEDKLIEFANALNEIDQSITSSDHKKHHFTYALPEQKKTIADAIDETYSIISLNKSLNHISHEYIYCYPPGIPLITPGEVISEDILNELKILKETDTKLYFSESTDDTECVSVCS